ncbi:MAG: Ig-like domain-containing protein [Clostridia bacterium]|nr:Ig-like domain-containing protein [Clostridia bacterium]
MKKRIIALVLLLIMVLSLLPLQAYAQSALPQSAQSTGELQQTEEEPQPPEEPPILEEIHFVDPSVTLGEGQSVKLMFTTVPADFAADYQFTSSLESVATVDSEGNVTAIAEGTALITVSYGEISDTMEIIVEKAVVPAESIRFWKSDFCLGLGESVTALILPTPTNATLEGLLFSTSDKRILTVNQNGVITAKKVGKATITAALGKLKASVKIEVKNAPKTLSLNYKDVKLGLGETTLDLDSSCKGGYALVRNFVSSNKNVVTVTSSGKVKAVGKGSAKITCTVYNGLKTVCKITVGAAPTSVKFKQASTTMQLGTHAKTTAFTINKGAYSFYSRITSSNNSIVTVFKNGTLKALKAGKAKVTVRLFNGVYAQQTVVVKKDQVFSPNKTSLAASCTYTHVQRYIYGKSYQKQILEAYIINPFNKKTLFIDFTVHGFEDASYRDGKYLTNEANKLISYYAKYPKELGNYRLVIVPCANPDGAYHGKNNLRACASAFGRCTANHVDINRDFLSRKAVETRGLIKIIDLCKPNVYLNCHGWLDEAIGTSSLCTIVQNSLHLSYSLRNRYAYDQGYAIGYVRAKYGIPCCLVEYPAPNAISHKNTVNMIQKIIKTY